MKTRKSFMQWGTFTDKTMNDGKGRKLKKKKKGVNGKAKSGAEVLIEKSAITTCY